MPDSRCHILIVGGSLGGVAAAMRAGEMGANVVMLEHGQWIGGQLTAQGVCTPDENRWIESSGGTASYRKFREQTRDHYRNKYRLSESGEKQEHLNVGGCWVSRMAVEPKVAHGILMESLAALPNVEVHLNAAVLDIENRINTVSAVTAKLGNGTTVRYLPDYVLDATELGDLLPMAGVEHVVGAESRHQTAEPDAPEQERSDWIQPFTFPFALELRPEGEDHTIPRPHNYESMHALQQYHILDGAMRGMFGELGWWTYRRIIDAAVFDDEAIPCDVAMINTGSNDFKGGTIPGENPAHDAETLEQARQASLGYVYWLQTECPRVGDPLQKGYPELKLRGDLFDTADGIAPQPYVRESRRIRAKKTVLEQEIVAADSAGNPHQTGARAAIFHDSVGIGHYWLDIHEGGTDEPNRFLETKPFQIPLGALIPIRVTNLVPACKNLGVTHLTNGAYRLHPIEWNVGESAGALAAFCLETGKSLEEVLKDNSVLREFQQRLLAAGVPLYWWSDLPSDHSCFQAAQMLAIEGVWPDEGELAFRPDEQLDPTIAGLLVDKVGKEVSLLHGLTRGTAAQLLFDSKFAR